LGYCGDLEPDNLKQKGGLMEFNRNQKVILGIALGTIILTIIFPPWIEIFSGRLGIHSERPIGYAMIFLPPNPHPGELQYSLSIDFSRLILQWLIVILTAGGLLFWMKDR
jgi:hypothetical protein